LTTERTPTLNIEWGQINPKAGGGCNIDWGQNDPKATQGLKKVCQSLTNPRQKKLKSWHSVNIKTFIESCYIF